MVAGGWGEARLAVDDAGGGFFCERFCCHDVVEAPAYVAFDPLGVAVVPVSVLIGLLIELAEEIDEAEGHCFFEGGLGGWMETDVVAELFGVVNINVFGSNVEVPYPDDEIGGFKTRFEVGAEAFEPLELVGEFVGIGHVAVGDVGVYDNQFAGPGLDEAGVVGGAAVIETELDIGEAGPAEDGDAVITFLAAVDALVAGTFDGEAGEVVVDDLGFLETDDIRLTGLEPV